MDVAGLVRMRVGFWSVLKAVDTTLLPLAPQLLTAEVAVTLSQKGAHPPPGLLQVTVIAWSAATAWNNTTQQSNALQ